MLNNLTWIRGNDHGLVVKRGYWLLEATQCFNLLYFHTHEKVFFLSNKNSMVLLIYYNNISWIQPCFLVSFTWYVTFWPSFIPLSIWTSKIFSQTIFFHCSYLSLGLIHSPWPWHSMHTDWNCWTIPGLIWWILICFPVPQQLGQHSTAPFLLPWPSHLLLITFIWKASFLVALLYKSRVIKSWCTFYLSSLPLQKTYQRCPWGSQNHHLLYLLKCLFSFCHIIPFSWHQREIHKLEKSV
jgi:hypothetical protein